MKKKVLLAIGLMGLSLAAQAQEPQQWSCNWNGNWGVQGNPQTDPMKMEGFMFAADGGWVLRANSADSFGPSHIRAGCGDGECWVEQKYADGDGKGSSYYFQLKSKDVAYRQGVKTIDYKGTWGDKEEAATHTGFIELRGTCTSLKLENPEEIDALMKKQLGWDEESY